MSAALLDFAALTTSITAYFILSQVPQSAAKAEALAWSLLPLIGAFMASLTAFFLNRISENPKAVAGRVICSIVFGVTVPRILAYSFPWMKNFMDDPLLVVASGYICGLFGYAAAVYLVDRMFKIAPSVVDKGMEQFAERVSIKVVEKTAAAVQPLAVEAAASRMADDISSQVVAKTAAGLEPQVGRLIDDVAEAVSDKVVDKTHLNPPP